MSLALELHQAAPPLSRVSASARTGRRSLDSAVLYCLLVVLLPVLAVPAFIALGRSDFFLHHGASIWVQSNDAIFTMQSRRDCDVLVFGDSTAMTGIDPDVVERQTGFKTCNIAVTNAVLAVTGNMTLDHFLAQNARPKMLIIQLSPDDFLEENRQWQRTIYPEGLLELLRHGSPDETRQVLLKHPAEAVSFAGYAAGYSAFYAIKDVWARTTHIRPEEDQIRVRNGFFTPPAPARTYCEASARVRSASEQFPHRLADQYRQRYSNSSAVVLVDVAPIPACDDNLKAFSHELAGVTSNSLEALPIGLFNDGRHYTAFGSRVVSTMISRQVNQVAVQNPELDNRLPSTNANLAVMHRVALQH